MTAKAGCGKTTIAAHITQTLFTHQSPEALLSQNHQTKPVVLYFFFQKSNNEAIRTAPAALRTAIRQLVRQVPAVLPILLKRHDALSAHGDFEWSWENLSGVFSEISEHVSLSSEVCVILDALDECDVGFRMLLLNWMKVMVENSVSSTTLGTSNANVKILLTGRACGDIIDQLSGYPTLEITDSDTKNGVRALIHNQVADFARQRHLKPDIARRIVQFLESNAHGMFLWVVLIMKDLERREERLSDEMIALRLSSTPLTLIDTYKAILQSAHPNRKQDMWGSFAGCSSGAAVSLSWN